MVLITLFCVIGCREQTVNIFLADGSLQCGTKQESDLISEMQTTLNVNNIQIYNSYKSTDGLMQAQMCGAPTGNINIFTINKRDLNQATKLGFQRVNEEGS